MHNPRGISDITVQWGCDGDPQSMSQKGQFWGLDWFHLERLERGPDPCLQIAKDSHGAKRTDVFCAA